MTGVTHALIGANTAWLSLLYFEWISSFILILIGSLAGLLPDLDASESKAKHLSIKGIEPLAPLAIIGNTLFKHRGFLHSLLIVIILTTGGWFLIQYLELEIIYLIVGICGYLSHILADMLTKSGVKIFWPVKKDIRLLPKKIALKTGGHFEEVIFVSALLGVALFCVYVIIIL